MPDEKDMQDVKQIPASQGSQLPGEASGEQLSLPGIAVGTFQFAHHEGPLPPPEVLAGYEQVVPGLAERLILLTEREASHRHQMDREQLDILRTDQSQSGRLVMISMFLQSFLIFAVLITALIVVLVADEVTLGSILTGITAFGVLLVQIMSLFRRSNRTESSATSEH